MRRTQARRSGGARRRGSVWPIVAAAAVSLVALGLLLMPLFGLKMYVITGASMTGSIGRGAVILDKTVPVSSLKVGDIITFCPPEQSGTVTHRIVSLERQADGEVVFKTKGDFNEDADPWQFTLDRPVQAKYVMQIPYIGYAFAFLSLRMVRALLFAIPVLLMVLVAFVTLWRRSGEARWIDAFQDSRSGTGRRRRSGGSQKGGEEAVMRRLTVLLAAVAVLSLGALVQFSGASFTSGSTSTVRVATDRIQNWLHLYSQSTDPDGLTGYRVRLPGTSPAATGADATLAVNLGILPKNTNTVCNRVLTIKAPDPFPTGASMTVTASLVASTNGSTTHQQVRLCQRRHKRHIRQPDLPWGRAETPTQPQGQSRGHGNHV